MNRVVTAPVRISITHSHFQPMSSRLVFSSLGVCLASTFGWCNLSSSGSGEREYSCTCCRDRRLFGNNALEDAVLKEMQLQRDRGGVSPADSTPVNTQPKAGENMDVKPTAV